MLGEHLIRLYTGGISHPNQCENRVHTAPVKRQ